MTYEEVLPNLTLSDGVPYLVAREPSGASLSVVALTDGTEASTVRAGVYGQDEGSPSWWDLDKLHGGVRSLDDQLVHRGARHHLASDGRWLQPEPLLYLGLTNGDLAEPLGYGPVYARGNSNEWSDRSGNNPMQQLGAMAFGGDMISRADQAIGQGLADRVNAYGPGEQVPMHLQVAATAYAFSKDEPILAGFATGGALPAARMMGRAGRTVMKALRGLGTGGSCFVAETEVATPTGEVPIEEVKKGDLVLAAASVDEGEAAWVAVEATRVTQRGSWAPRAFAMACAALSVGCDVAPELPAADEVVQVHDARTGAWAEEVGAELEVGDTFIDQGQVRRLSAHGVEVRGEAAIDDLADADAAWVAEAAHRLPHGDEWVLVLGAGDDAGHWRLSDVEPGQRFAFQGRVFDAASVDANADLEVRTTERVLAEVVQTFRRMVVDEVIDLRVAYAGGHEAVITGTHEHPFYVPALDRYVPLGELEPGAVLRTDAGGDAVVVALMRRGGDFEVFNIEVGEAHTYFVRGAGSEGPGALVHNKSMKLRVSFTGGQVGQKFGRHGKEFGLEMSTDGARAYKEMAQEVVALPDEVRKGAWNPKGGGGDNYNFYAQDDALVVTDADDNFVTMFKQNEGGNEWFNNATPVE